MALDRAEFCHQVMTTYPAYTLGRLLRADAWELFQLRALLDADLGKARDVS